MKMFSSHPKRAWARSSAPFIRTYVRISFLELNEQNKCLFVDICKEKWMENNGKTTWKHWHFAEIERDRERSSPTESEQETRMSLLCNSFLLPINQWDLWILTCSSSSSVRVMPFGTVTHIHSSIAFFLVINVRMGSMLINAFLFK